MDINDNVISKAALWADRIHAFQKSGLSRKDWCQQNEISQSTLGYWIRKIQSEIPETGPASDPVFAKLTSDRICSLTAAQEIIRLPSFFRKISGLRLTLTVHPGCWLRFCRP